MLRTTQSGFGKLALIVIIGALGAAYFVKDETGESYLHKGYEMGHYYIVERNTAAIKAAQDVKSVAQKQQEALKAELNN